MIRSEPIAAARAILRGFHRRETIRTAAKRAVTALSSGGAVAALAGGGAVAGCWPWLWAIISGGIAFAVILFARPPWQGLPKLTHSAWALDHCRLPAAAGQNIAATALVLDASIPFSPEAIAMRKAFSKWLEPHLSLLQAASRAVPLCPTNVRWLILSAVILAAEMLLTLALADVSDAASLGTSAALDWNTAKITLLADAEPPINGAAPINAEKLLAEHREQSVAELRRQIAEAALAAETAASRAIGKNAAANNVTIGTGESDSSHVRVHLKFGGSVPALSPTAVRNILTVSPEFIPVPYRDGVKKYLQLAAVQD